MKIEDVACICHQAVVAFDQTIRSRECRDNITWPNIRAHIGNDWITLSEKQRQEVIEPVKRRLENPTEPPGKVHDDFVCAMKELGWKHGPALDFVKKESTLICPYAELPQEEKIRRILFDCIVMVLSQYVVT